MSLPGTEQNLADSARELACPQRFQKALKRVNALAQKPSLCQNHKGFSTQPTSQHPFLTPWITNHIRIQNQSPPNWRQGFPGTDHPFSWLWTLLQKEPQTHQDALTLWKAFCQSRGWPENKGVMAVTENGVLVHVMPHKHTRTQQVVCQDPKDLDPKTLHALLFHVSPCLSFVLLKTQNRWNPLPYGFHGPHHKPLRTLRDHAQTAFFSKTRSQRRIGHLKTQEEMLAHAQHVHKTLHNDTKRVVPKRLEHLLCLFRDHMIARGWELNTMYNLKLQSEQITLTGEILGARLQPSWTSPKHNVLTRWMLDLNETLLWMGAVTGSTLLPCPKTTATGSLTLLETVPLATLDKDRLNMPNRHDSLLARKDPLGHLFHLWLTHNPAPTCP